MSFVSLTFALFFVAVFAAYWVFPPAARWAVLLLASWAFYAKCSVAYFLLALGATVAVYICTACMDKFPKRKKLFAALAIAYLLGELCIFKYFDAFCFQLQHLLKLTGVEWEGASFSLVLPLAMSFWTFQNVGYIIDAYKGKVKIERHFGYVALFVAFFPQLMTGPIERGKNLFGEFRKERIFDYRAVVTGLRRIVWGFFKKAVIADSLGALIAPIWVQGANPGGLDVVLGVIAFSIQVYLDFSGCADIAIGCAGTLGIKLSENFNQPHYATSISMFWTRWHITLSNWLRDYIYIPFARKHKSRLGVYAAIMLTFFVTGIWHGSWFNFIVWGLIHGAYRVISDITKIRRYRLAKAVGLTKCPALHRWYQIIVTFALVCFARIFFVSPGFMESLRNIRSILFRFNAPSIVDWFSAKTLVLAAFIAIFEYFQYRERRDGSLWKWIEKMPIVPRFAVYIVLVAVIMIITHNATGSAFIYNEF